LGRFARTVTFFNDFSLESMLMAPIKAINQLIAGGSASQQARLPSNGPAAVLDQ